jgi:leucine dehydrogenase
MPSDLMPPEHVVRLEDAASGLRGFIVVHSTALGPAAGGCRLRRYDSEAAASGDALRLAGAITMKNALAGLPLGGGQAVLMLPDAPFNRQQLFRAFGRAVDDLGGAYLTAEDVGTSVEDMALVAEQTRHVAGLPPRAGGGGGDPSAWTARGVFRAMEVAVARRLGRSIGEVTVAIQGVGRAGFALCQLLHDGGARLLIAETRSDLAARAAMRFGADLIPSNRIAAAGADVFAPCALGGALDVATVSTLRASVVCGAADNQLAAPEIDAMLARRGILYAPDYLVNAGGIIDAAAEHLGWSPAEVAERVDAIAARLERVLDLAGADGVEPGQAAAMLARRAIDAARSPVKAMLAA